MGLSPKKEKCENCERESELHETLMISPGLRGCPDCGHILNWEEKYPRKSKAFILNEMVKVANDLDSKGLIEEADIITGLIEKIAQSKKDDFKYRDLEGTVYIRLLEMTVESRTVPANNVPLVLQFFKDLRLYGLNEAIAYVKGYEEQGYYEPGTTQELIKVKQKIHEGLRQPLTPGKGGSYVFNEDMSESIDNRFYKVEGSLPRISSEDEVLVTKEWVEKFASLTGIPVELAYIWATGYWSKGVITPEVQSMSDGLKQSGKVVIDF